MDRDLVIKYLKTNKTEIKKFTSFKLFLLNIIILLISIFLCPEIFINTICIIIIIISLLSEAILFYKFSLFKKHLVFCINILCVIISLNMLSISIMIHEKHFNVYILLLSFLIQLFMIFPSIKLIKIGKSAIIKQSSNNSILFMEIISLLSFLGYICGTIIYSIFEEVISLSVMLIIFQFIMFAIILILVGNILKTYLIKKYFVKEEELFIEKKIY